MASESKIKGLEARIRDLEEENDKLRAKLNELVAGFTGEPENIDALSVLLEHTEDAILISDQNGIPRVFNAAYARAMKELLGLEMKPGIQPHKLLDNPAAIKYWDDLHRRALRGEKFSADFSHPVGDKIRHFEHVFCPIVRGGEVEGFSEVTREITDRVAAESALRDSERNYRTIFNAARDAIIIFDHQSGTVLDANVFACEHYGYSLDEFRQLKAVDISAEPEKTLEVLKEETRFVPLRYHKDKGGEVFPVEVSINYHFRGKQKIITAVVRDISLRQQSKKALFESERKFRNVVESSPMGVLLYELMPDRQLIFRGANPSAHRILGVDRSSFVGRPIEEVFPPLAETEIPERYREVCETGNSWMSEQVNYDDKVIRGAYEVYAFQTSPNNMAVFFLDITERKRAELERQQLEEQLKQAQKMEAVGTLAGGIAHDFNNLLMGIVGNTSLLLSDMDESHPHFDRLKNIEEASQSGADLTQQLLGFARGGKYQVKATDLNRLIEKNAKTFGRTRKDLELRFEFENGIWAVEIDRGQFEQVILNLFVNASQAMPTGGKLFVSTRNLYVKEDMDLALRMDPGPYVRLTVTDTGVGMNPDILDRVFEPFFTTKEMGRGTGLGLATVYGIVKSHGGYIEVDSQEGQGTTFRISLPSTGKKVVEETKELGEEITGRETVLLVDDEKMVLEVGREMLQHLGYRVLTAESGQSAIELVEQNVGSIDLIILDMIMPKMSGSDTYDRLREAQPDIKVLLSSGYSINGEAAEIMARGCNGFIQKPFNIRQLSRKLRALLDG